MVVGFRIVMDVEENCRDIEKVILVGLGDGFVMVVEG